MGSIWLCSEFQFSDQSFRRVLRLRLRLISGYHEQRQNCNQKRSSYIDMDIAGGGGVGGPNEGGGVGAGGTYFPRFSTNEVPARQEKTSEAAGSCGEESCS